jgi:hypothetical protein
VGALLCEPADPANCCGVIFFNNVGTLGMCGHGTIGLVATLAEGGPDLPRTVGRLHPLVVHFPIALALVAVAFEWWRVVSRRSGMSPLTLPLLVIAAATAVVSTACSTSRAPSATSASCGS